MDERQAYEILRNLTSPLVAVTCRRGEKLNGMIVNSAVRASLVPGRQRVSHYVFKRHFSHGILVETGRYVLHLLSRAQWDEIWELGFHSGRDRDKFREIPHRLSKHSGIPVLTRCYAWMECRVVNVMDAGASTFFMGQVERMERGEGEKVMDSGWFRENMPEEWREPYLANLREVQEWAARHEPEIDDRPWRELSSRHDST